MSIEGLRQAFIDFDSRLRLDGEWREERYPRLIGIVAEGGFLAAKSQAETETTTRSDPFMLHLNPNLNTIIGGRGSGKSALVELIRYAFDLPAKTKANEKQAGDILRATFPTGAKVMVYYELPDGTIYQIERISGSSPRVFEVFSGEERIGLHPASILLGSNPIEVYGQKEIYEISKDATFQLRLIDNYIAEDLKPILENERLILRDLEALATEAARLRSEIEDKEQQIRDLPGIEEELRRLELDQAMVRLQMKKQLDAEKRLLDGAQQAVNTLLQDIDQFRRQHSGLAQIMNQEVREGMPHADILAAQAMLLTEIDDKLNSGLSNITETVSSTWERGATGRATWQSAYDAEEEHYAALLREFQDLSADRYISLQALRAKLKQQNEDLEAERRKLRDLCQTRCQRLLDLRALRRDCEFSLRSQKAQELSNRLGEMMTVAVIREGNRDAYAEYLTDFFAGSGIAHSVVDSIVNSRISKEYTDPIQLVEAIRLEQTSPSDTNSALNQVFNISQAYRRRLAQLSEDVLAKLETYRVPDLPDIRLKVGDNYRSLITPLGQPGLSTGQKCTAVLSLILIEQRTPLIVDQPEDDLDNQFIFDEIVTTLRREKERRQFIVATHNANIPVSGDAELIIIMNADEQHGWIDCFGSIDDSQLRTPIETVLEGGEKAFQIRKEKYGI
jgi:energy-coupling factor transporter ATP-binding protein EcfA2